MLSCLLFKITKEDLNTYRIPDIYSLAIAVIGISFCGAAALPSRIIIAQLVFIISGMLTGMGDAKLFAALAFIMGKYVFMVFALSFIVSSAYLLPSLLLGRVKLSDRIPFSPFIAVSALTVFLTNYHKMAYIICV